MRNEQNQLLKDEINSIFSIEWRYDSTKVDLHTELIKLYLLHCSEWIHRYNLPREGIYYDFTKLVSTKRAPKDLILKLENHFEQEPFIYAPQNGKTFCFLYLDWLFFLHDDSEAKNLSLSDPFQPLITFFKNGGEYRIENRMLFLPNGVGISIHDFFSDLD